MVVYWFSNQCRYFGHSDVGLHCMVLGGMATVITIFVNLGFFWHFETVTNIRTWINSHKYWRML